ncbi:hypothetical protein PtrM4_099400 [Pyrenophora tritici-repentis]|uniref:Reverse transcriptase domain-containing protein n=1 Tax=Pyrenophora tritici-repentis TaxID=45151 RepID=A0A834VQN1_9PLEO|nr:hypothetical protein PtrM4_099400 [Pyrenophora tritici-repentis]
MAEAFDHFLAKKLPPHRKGVNLHIKIEKDQDGNEKTILWGPLYGMSREELLVLRKTLTELLDKDFICDYLNDFVSAYVNDILIYSLGSLQDHKEKVRKVLQRLIDAGLQINIDKCEFETKRVKYLRYIVEAEVGIRVDPKKIIAIRE